MDSISLAPWKVMASLPYQADLSAYITAGRLIDPATNLVPWTDATVPGSIYRDLLREGLIKDPYYDCDPLGCGGIRGMDQLRRIFREEDQRVLTYRESRAWAHHSGGWDDHDLRERIMFGAKRTSYSSVIRFADRWRQEVER